MLVKEAYDDSYLSVPSEASMQCGPSAKAEAFLELTELCGPEWPPAYHRLVARWHVSRGLLSVSGGRVLLMKGQCSTF